MNVDDELQGWRDQWTAQPAGALDLTARVKRQSRLMRLMLLAEVLVTVLFGGGTIWLAAATRQVDVAVLAVATWVFLAAAWGFGVWNRRGAWRPVALTSSAYVEISIRRCRSAIRALIFGMALFVVEVLFCLAWIYNRIGDSSFLYSARMIAVGVATAVFFWEACYTGRERRTNLPGCCRWGGRCDDASGIQPQQHRRVATEPRETPPGPSSPPA